MREDLNREKMHKAIDSALSGLNGDPWLFQRISSRAAKGEMIVKKKLSAGLVLALVILLIAVTALAVALLSPKEVVEQVAVPMAQENDLEWRIETDFTPDELASLLEFATPTSFGDSVLRAETAAVFGLSVMSAVVQAAQRKKL